MEMSDYERIGNGKMSDCKRIGKVEMSDFPRIEFQLGIFRIFGGVFGDLGGGLGEYVSCRVS